MASTGGRRVARRVGARDVYVKDEEDDEKQDFYHYPTMQPVHPYVHYAKQEHPQYYTSVYYAKQESPQHHTSYQQQPLRATRPSSVPFVKPRRVKKEELYDEPVPPYQSFHHGKYDSHRSRQSSRAPSIDPGWGPEADDVEIVNQQLTDAMGDVEKLEEERDAERKKRWKSEKRLQKLLKEREESKEVLQRQVGMLESKNASLSAKNASLSAENASVSAENASLSAKVEKLLNMVERQELRHRREMVNVVHQSRSTPTLPLFDNVTHHTLDLRQVRCTPEALAALAARCQDAPADVVKLPVQSASASIDTPRPTPAIHIDDSPIFAFHQPGQRAIRNAGNMERLASSNSSNYETASSGSTTVKDCSSSCCARSEAATPSPVFIGSPDWRASVSLENCLISVSGVVLLPCPPLYADFFPLPGQGWSAWPGSHCID